MGSKCCKGRPPVEPVLKTNAKIEVADPLAFNDSLIQQRQQAIYNHSYRTIIESWNPNSLQELVQIIKSFSKGKNLVDRHWIIFYWITSNIQYDTVSYFSKDYKDQSAEGVFRTKKGVCAGYANIYKYLCDQLQMPCEIVGGYSKGYGFDDREGAPAETDHAWNAVEIDHHWYLMESTWGAGHLNKQKTFEPKLNSYYFLPRPNEMIYHHLPEDEKWQLLRTPIKMEQYMQLPNVYPSYFELNIELINPRNQAQFDLVPDKPYALVLLQAPSDVHLIADLSLHDQKIDGGHRVIFDNQKQLYYCYFAPSNIGKHKITIYGKRGVTESGTHSAVIDLTLNISQIPINPINFPKTWDNFFDLGLEVIRPENTHLIKLNSGAIHAEIRIKTPEYVELLGCLENENGEEVIGGNQIYYDRRKNIWKCNFAPNRDGLFEAVIMAKKKSDVGSYSSAISFKIEAKQIPSSPLSYPKTWQLFHDLDMKIITPRDQATIILSKSQSEIEIHLQTPDDVHLLGRLTNDKDEKIKDGHQIFYDRQKGFWRCKFAPNEVGIFNALIMAKKKTDPGKYSSAISFKVEAKQIPSPHLSYPETWPLFYDLDLKIEAPRNSSHAIWPDNASYAEVLIQAPDDVQLSCGIKYENVEVKNGSIAQFDNNKKLWQLLFAPQQTGTHELIVYANRNTDTESTSAAAAKFYLEVTKLRRPIKFPLVYTKFQTNKCQIYTPIDGILKKGSVVPIHCIIPGATDVNFKVDSEWLKSEGYKDPILQRQVTVGSKEVTIYAKYGEKSSYDGLVKYTVQ
jgi:hypothetical protein